jgi:hypothetical protein
MTRFTLIPCFLIASACAPEAQEFSATPDSRDMTQGMDDGAERALVNPGSTSPSRNSMGEMLVELAINKTGQLAKQQNCEIVGALAARVNNNLNYSARMLSLDGETFGQLDGKFVFSTEKDTGKIYGSTSNQDQPMRVKMVGDFINSSIEADIHTANQDGMMSAASELRFFGEWEQREDHPGAMMLGVIADCE